MRMVRDEGPGAAAYTGFGEEASETRERVLTIRFPSEDTPELYAPDDNVVCGLGYLVHRVGPVWS